MNRNLLLIFLGLILFLGNSIAQTASDVLEKGIVIDKNKKMILHIEDNTLKYDLESHSPLSLTDSTIFLPKSPGVRIYMTPLNPLNYSYSDTDKLIIDPIDAAATKNINADIAFFSKMNGGSNTSQNPGQRVSGGTPSGTGGGNRSNTSNSNQNTGAGITQNHSDCKKYLDTINKEFENIQDSLSLDQKTSIIKCFKRMKALDFLNQQSTIDSIDSLKLEIRHISSHFSILDKMMKEARTKLVKCLKACDSAVSTKYIYANIIKQFSDIEQNQKLRLANLQKAYQLIDSVWIKSSPTDGSELKWCTFLKEVDLPNGKVAIYTVNIYKAGYTISDSGEITIVKKKSYIKKLMYIRRFASFIPEVSAGTAYANLSFPKYGTTTDSVTKKQYVASAGNQVYKKLSITGMLNIVFFIPNDNFLNPFFQIGIGDNTDYPAFFTGIGLRLNSGLKRLAISWGVASTWIQELNTLKIGDEVSGTAQVQNDLVYQFKWPPQFYYGIQYNF